MVSSSAATTPSSASTSASALGLSLAARSGDQEQT